MRFLVVALSILGSFCVSQGSSMEELLSKPKICCNADPEESMEATEEICLTSSVSGLESLVRQNGKACCTFREDIHPIGPTKTPQDHHTTTPPVSMEEMPCEGVLVIAGDSWEGRLSSVEVLGPSTETFPDLPTPRWGHLAFHLPAYNQFLVCGGKGNHHDPRYLQTCLNFNYTLSNWTEHSKLLFPRHFASDVTMESGDIYVIGGSYAATTTEVLANGAIAWTQGPDLPQDNFIVKACASVVNSTHLVTVGGGIYYTQVTTLDTTTELWTSWPDLEEGRRGHSCGNLQGRIVVAGGYLFSNFEYTDTTIILDSNGVKVGEGKMTHARSYFRLEQLVRGGRGSLVAIGGSTIYTALHTVEQLDTLSGDWTPSNWTLKTGRSTFATVPCRQRSSGSPPMETVYTKAEEQRLVKGTLLTTLDTLGKEWRVTHEFKPTHYSSRYTTSLHLTVGGDVGQYGERILAIIIWPDFSDGKMHIFSTIGENKNYDQAFAKPPVGAWTTIAVSQTLEGGKYMHRITIGGQEAHAVENQNPREFQDIKVYTSSPWRAAQQGSIRNLLIETRMEEHPLVEGSGRK